MKVLFSRFIPFWLVFFVNQSIWTVAAYGQSGTVLADVSSQPLSGQQSLINKDSEQSLSSAAVPNKTKSTAVVKEYLLNNGLKIIFIKDKAFPFVSCFTWYKVGSRDDPPGMAGLTHLVEHLLFQNIGSFNSNQWANVVVRAGGEFSGFTSEDFTAFYSNLPTYQLELAIRGEAARMRGAHFTKADVTKEVEQLVKEEKAEEQDPLQMLNREVHALAYDSHPYRNPPGGWRHELEHLTINEAKAHYDKYFQPNNASLILVGNFDEPLASNLIEKYFRVIAKSENIPANAYPRQRPQLAERQIKLKAREGKESIILAYKVTGLTEADAPVISVVEQFLNAQIRGALHAQLIDSGLCSYAQVVFEQKRDPGLLLIKCTGIAPDGSYKVLQILDSCINQLKAKQFSDAELNRIIQQTEFTYYCDGDGPYRRAFQTGFFTTLAKSEDVYSWPKKIQQVSAADILRVARLYLNESNRVFGNIVIGNGNLVNEGMKNDLPSGKMSDSHYRLAGYPAKDVKSYTVPAKNTALVQAVPVAPAKASVGSEHDAEEYPLQYKTLRNGLRIVVLESRLSPLVQIYGAVKAGSALEHADERGMSKLLAGIFNMGNARSQKQQLITAQSDLGMTPDAMLKFSSDPENITFQIKCLGEDFPSQLRQLLGCLMEPRLQSADFEAAKTEVVVNLRREEKLPATRVNHLLLRNLIAQKSPYFPLHVEEEINSMNNFKLNDLIDFYHEHVNPTNTLIVICGDVHASEVFSSLEQLTQGWILNTQAYVSLAVGKNVGQPELIIANKHASKSSLIAPSASPSEIVFGRIISVSDIKQVENYWAALSIADCILSSHPISSHMGEQFNTKSELFDNAADYPWNTKIFKLENKLIWSLDIHLPPKSSSSAAVNTIQNLLLQFSRCGLRQDEVLEAKKYLIGNIPVGQCSNLNELTNYTFHGVTFHGVTDLNEIAPIIKMQKTINSLKYEEINEFIAKIFKPETAALVIIGSRELIKQVHPIQQAESSEVNSD